MVFESLTLLQQAPARRSENEESGRRANVSAEKNKNMFQAMQIKQASIKDSLTKSFCAANSPRTGMARMLGWLSVLLLLICPATHAQQVRGVTWNGPADGGRGETDHTAPAQRNPRYLISRDDVLMISFPLSPELNQKVTVQPDGFISLQNAGDIHVQGLTAPAAVEVVKKAYAGTLHDPIVDIDLTDFQKPFFTVLGQVGKPGQYDLRADITVTQAIAIAGGFAMTGKTQVFLYRAVSSNWAQVRELKLKDFLHGKNINEDVHLQPGDMIFVPEKAIAKFKEYVPYSFAVTPPYPTAW